MITDKLMNDPLVLIDSIHSCTYYIAISEFFLQIQICFRLLKRDPGKCIKEEEEVFSFTIRDSTYYTCIQYMIVHTVHMYTTHDSTYICIQHMTVHTYVYNA